MSRRQLAWAALLACTIATPTVAATLPPDAFLLAACDAPGFARVLAPASRTQGDARAYWLDRRLLQWPKAPADGHFVLYHSGDARLRAERGSPVAGADVALPLTTSTGPLPDAAARFRFIAAGPVLALAERDLARLPRLLTGQLLLVREDAAGKVLDATGLQLPGVLDDLYANDATVPDLGAGFDADATRLRLWAPTARGVAVCVYENGPAPATAVGLQREPDSGLWSTRIPRDLRGKAYAYLVDVFVPGVGVVRNRVTDPYSASLTADSLRSVAVDLDAAAFKPDGWDAAPRPPAPAAMVDMAIYELHVRDFSRDDASVPPGHRGKYLAFGDRDSSGMRHLRALAGAGLTDVHLLPVFDLASVPESGCRSPRVPDAAPDGTAQRTAVAADAAADCFNWGYDPYHFNAPEGSYASDAADGGARVREFREMVMALHAAGLRVGMDVVYNHTTASGQSATSVLDRIVPGYYHRLDADGAVAHSTCCENTATEHRMMAKLMIDSVVSWATHYAIDSFRFDLMGHQPRAAMEQLQQRVDAAAGRTIPLIGEGWNFGEVADGVRFVQASQNSLGGSGIATFSDRARDAIRGGGPGDHGIALRADQGYINGLVYDSNEVADPRRPRADLLHAADLVRVGLAGTLRDYRMTGADGVEQPLSRFDYKGQPAGYASQPGEVVNYVENHDNQTLFDIDALKLPLTTSRPDRARVQMLGAALVSFSQGVAYFHAGIDTLRSKSMDRNSFDSGDWFNRVDWTCRDNFFATGLPPQADNGVDDAVIAPLLADPRIKPGPRDIAFACAQFRDLLRIRASSTLFRLRTAADVRQRLRFANIGPAQNPLVIAGYLDGNGYPGANFRELLYLVNVAPTAQTLTLPVEAGKHYVLHPVQRNGPVDRRALAQARFQSHTGRFTVPARTAVVWVVE